MILVGVRHPLQRLDPASELHQASGCQLTKRAWGMPDPYQGAASVQERAAGSRSALSRSLFHVIYSARTGMPCLERPCAKLKLRRVPNDKDDKVVNGWMCV